MAKTVHPRYHSHTRDLHQETEVRRSQRRTRASLDSAERDLLASVLDASAECHDLQGLLSRVAPNLGNYARCNSIGILVREGEGFAACTSAQSGAVEFQRIAGSLLAASDARICNVILRGISETRPSYLTDGMSFFRSRKPGRGQTTEGPSGLCAGSAFQTLGFVPVACGKEVIGFVLIGDERKDRISPAMARSLERIGRYLGSSIRALQAHAEEGPPEHGRPTPAEEVATTPRQSDEMELLTQLMENSNEAIVITQDWRIIYVNRKCTETAGLSKDELIGLAFLDITHPDDRQAVKERYSRILNGEWPPTGTTVRGLDKDGSTTWAEIREIPFSWHGRPAIMSLVNDITDRRRAEEALAASEKKYRQLVETLDEGIGAIDEDAKIVFVNARLAEILGYTVDEMTGKPLLSFLAEVADEPGKAAAPLKLESRRRGFGEMYEAVATRKNGTKIHLSVRSSPILGDEDNCTGVIAAVQDITEQKKAEQALRDSERLYRFLADNTTDVIWVTDLNLRPSYLSPSINGLLGYSVEESMSGSLDTRLTAASAKLAADALADAIARETREPGSTRSRTMELELVRKDGSTVWVDTTVSLMRDTKGQATGILGAMRNVTDRRRAREALRVSEEKYRLIAERVNDLIYATDLNLKATYVSPSVERLLGFTAEEYSSLGPDQQMTPSSMKRVWEALSEQLDLEKDPKADPGRTVRLELEYYRKDGSTTWLENVLTGVRDANGALIGVHGVARDITARRTAEAALRQSETNYKNLFEHTLLGMEVVDGQTGKVALANRSLARMFGFKSPADMVGTSPLDYVLPEDMEWVAGQIVQLMGDPSWDKTAQIRARTDDGRIIWVTGMGTPIDYEGRPAMLLSLIDITAVKEAEDKLYESEERHRLVLEQANEAIIVLQDGLVKFSNPKGAELVGRSAEGFSPSPFLDFIHPDDRQLMAENHVKRLAGEDVPNNYTFRMIDGQGNTRWMQINAVRLDWEGKPAVLSILNDITDRTRADEALKASEERFRTIIENARDAVTILDENYTITYESPSLAAVTGHSPEEWLGKSLGEVQIHPDDLPLLASQFELLKCQPGLVIEDAQVRYKHKDGSWHVIEATGRNLLNDPRVKGILVNFRDITARKQAEDALHQEEQRFRGLAENSSDIVLLINTEGAILYESPAGQRLLGLTPEERVGQSIFDRVHPDDLPMVTGAYRDFLRDPHAALNRVDELRLQHKDGSWRTMEAAGSAIVRDAKVEGIVVNVHDITERKRAEQALRESEEKFRTLAEQSPNMIFINVQGHIVYANNLCEQMMGYTPEEFLSPDFDFQTLTAPEYRQLIEDKFRIHMSGREVDPYEYSLITKDGHRLDAILSTKLVTYGRERAILGTITDITERKRAEQALRESEKRYRLLAENITDVIWTTDIQANITYMSPSATRLVGFSPEELSKMTVADLLTPDSFERGMKILAEQQSSMDLERDASPGHWTLEVQLRCKDGSSVWAEETVAFLRDEDGTPVGLVGVTRDISQRKLMEDSLRLSEDKYRTLVEASPDGVLSIDRQGIISDCNTGLCTMLGYEREQLRGREARLLATKKDLFAEPHYAERLIRGEFVEVETEIQRHDGQSLPVWAKAVRLAEPGTADIQTIIYFRDIADRRKIDEMKDEFIGLVSHELRSPLTVIIGALHTAISEAPRLSQKETGQLLEDAVLEAEQLSHLVGNLLELSRAQANRLILHVEPVNMSKAAHKVIESIRRQSPKHKFAVDLPKRLPSVPADQLRLERILYNLLENSVKYSPEGSEITVSARREAGHVVVSVSDQGTGISKEDQAKLFKPFQQLGTTMTDHTKGAGLGLLVCRRLVEAHGGRIWVESEPNHGATFYFTLEASPEQGMDANRP